MGRAATTAKEQEAKAAAKGKNRHRDRSAPVVSCFLVLLVLFVLNLDTCSHVAQGGKHCRRDRAAPVMPCANPRIIYVDPCDTCSRAVSASV